MRIRTVIVMAAALSVIAGAAASTEVVRLTNGEWPPFTSERLEHGGVLSRIVAESFALEGITVEYGYFPWKRAYQFAMTGEWDGSVGWALTPDHLRDFLMSEPVIFVDKALFHMKSTPLNWSKIEDLSQWRIAATAGYSYGQEWDEAVKNGRLKIETVTNDEQNIKRLLAGRIDAFAMEVDVANYLIDTTLTPDEARQLTYCPKLLAHSPICLALSRKLEKAPVLLKRFNDGLSKLKAAGLYDQYLTKSERFRSSPTQNH